MSDQDIPPAVKAALTPGTAALAPGAASAGAAASAVAVAVSAVVNAEALAACSSSEPVAAVAVVGAPHKKEGWHSNQSLNGSARCTDSCAESSWICTASRIFEGPCSASH